MTNEIMHGSKRVRLRHPFSRRRALLLVVVPLLSLFASSGLLNSARLASPAALHTMRDDLIVLNPNVDSRNGETSEFSTLFTVRQRLQELAGERATALIGLGEAFYFLGNRDRSAQEVFVWNDGSREMAYMSDPSTGEARVLGADVPLTFSAFDFVDIGKGVPVVYDSPAQAGKVLWNFHVDRTEKQFLFLTKGFHNIYSDTDAKATETLFEAAKDAHNRGNLEEKWRTKLKRFVPGLSEDAIWANFVSSTPKPENETAWLSMMRQAGWPAAAFVMEGSLLDTNHFRVTQVNKLNPHDGGLEPKDYFLENNSGSSEWIIVGYMVDPQHGDFERWQQSLEAFGQGIHFHGVRSDKKKMGHVLTAVLSDKPFRVTMYPLRILQTEESGIFNNDVSVRFGSVAAGQSTFDVIVENGGVNFVRNVDVILQEGSVKGFSARITVPLIKPGETFAASLHSRNPWTSGNAICATVDPDEKLIEGGKMKTNNRVCLQ